MFELLKCILYLDISDLLDIPSSDLFYIHTVVSFATNMIGCK